MQIYFVIPNIIQYEKHTELNTQNDKPGTKYCV